MREDLTNNSMIRVFAAVEVPEALKSELIEAQNVLKRTQTGVRWTHPGTMHITLRFIGNISEEVAYRLIPEFEKAVSRTGCFEITLGEIGVFPDWRSPRVIFAGIGAGSTILSDIAFRISFIPGLDDFPTNKVGEDQKRGGGRGKKDLVPHITMGRVKSLKNIKELKIPAKNIRFKEISSEIKEMKIFRSDLTPSGATHTPIAGIRF